MSISPGVSGFLLWREPTLTFYFLPWCDSMASGKGQQVSIRLGWFGGQGPPTFMVVRNVSVPWALQRLAHVGSTTFARRQEVPSTFLSYLTMCGWKEDKVGSALFSARERQPKRKVCFHMSKEAEVSLHWPWLRKAWSGVRSSSTERLYKLTRHDFRLYCYEFLQGTALPLLLPASLKYVQLIPHNCLDLALETLSACPSPSVLPTPAWVGPFNK